MFCCECCLSQESVVTFTSFLRSKNDQLLSIFKRGTTQPFPHWYYSHLGPLQRMEGATRILAQGREQAGSSGGGTKSGH